MNFYAIVVGPLLWITFSVFIIGILTRISFFFYAIIQSSKGKDQKWRYVFASIARLGVPFYRAITQKPFYAALLYLFHVSLIVVAIWASGHIVLLSTSRLGWFWTPLPDALVDVMTVFLLGFASFFLIRRIILADVIPIPSRSDFFLVVITSIPFLTGFIAYHQWFDYNIMLIIHILSGELMLIVVVFLFCRIKLNVETCIGCAACALNCLTGAIESRDTGRLRVFAYSPFQCIACGTCVSLCPEMAAELRHEISFKPFFQAASKREIRSVELSVCERCGCFFAPLPQLDKIERIVAEKKVEIPGLKYCDKCRRRVILEQMSMKVKVPLERGKTIY